MTITDDTAAKLREAAEAHTREENSETWIAFLAAAGPEGVAQTVLALLNERDSRPMPVAYTGSGSMMALRDGREGFIWMSPSEAHPIPLYAAPLTAIAAEARSTALEAERDAEKARADAAEAERDKARAKLFPYADATEISGVSFGGKYLIGDKKSVSYFHEMMNRGLQIDVYKRAYDERIAAAEATISTLTAERDALKRERDEARAAHDGWNPIATCPIREPVDLWCVYGGEEFAQYEGGASIGKLVPSRIKTTEYGFFGNQSDNGVPQRDAPDLVPVAWRKAVPSCPAIIIAEALHIPITLEDARAVLARTGEPTDAS